jgi:hypothetical protein
LPSTLYDFEAGDVDTELGGEREHLCGGARTVRMEFDLGQLARVDAIGQVGARSRHAAAVRTGTAVVAIDDVAHRRQAFDEAIHRRQDRRTVLRADVEPDRRVTGSDSGHVAEPAGGESQQRGMLLGTVAGQSHQRCRSEMGHMADDCHHLIVAVGRERHDIGSELGDHGRHPGERAVGSRARRSQHPHCAFEHRSVGAVEAFELAACHRVPTDEPGIVDCAGDTTLDAADVGDQP